MKLHYYTFEFYLGTRRNPTPSLSTGCWARDVVEAVHIAHQIGAQAGCHREKLSLSLHTKNHCEVPDGTDVAALLGNQYRP